MKETGSELGCFAGFCHHRLGTTNARTHAYHYPLFESVRFVNNRIDIVLLHKHKEQQ